VGDVEVLEGLGREVSSWVRDVRWQRWLCLVSFEFVV
jgi:hypothetical protein